jgi:hypothetical protein
MTKRYHRNRATSDNFDVDLNADEDIKGTKMRDWGNNATA